MAASRLGLALVLVVAPIACSPASVASAGLDGGPPRGVDGGSDGPGGGAAPGSDGGVGAGTADCAVDAGAADASSILSANQGGRTGADLVLTLDPVAGAEGSFGLDVRLRDKAGAPVAAFPAWNGAPSDSERIVLFDDVPPADPGHPTRTVTLSGMMRAFPAIRSVAWAIAGGGGESVATTTTVALQSVRTLGQSCDPGVVRDRCAPGQSCDSTTGTCTKASGPSLSQFAYLSTPLGGDMLLAGTDPADDLSSIHFEFLDRAGAPVGVDLTGNGDLATSIDQPVSSASTLGRFFFANQSSPGFDGAVAQLAATPSGALTGPGNRVTAMLQQPPAASTGEACDGRGFIGCVPGDVCVDDTCLEVDAARDAVAGAAPVLDPATGRAFATGYAHAVNLWGDPPPGCAPVGVRGFPEGIVRVHLSADAPVLVITTDNPETTVRAAVFVLAGTGSAPGGAPLGCNSGFPATLTLSDVRAGDYTIVVEATAPGGGNFGVSLR